MTPSIMSCRVAFVVAVVVAVPQQQRLHKRRKRAFQEIIGMFGGLNGMLAAKEVQGK